MPNKRLVEKSQKWAIPEKKKRTQKLKSDSNKSSENSSSSKNCFVFGYDGENAEFFKELMIKTNDFYSRKIYDIFEGQFGEVTGDLISRMRLIGTIANDSNLQSAGLLPITAAESENFLQHGQLPPGVKDNREEFGFIYYGDNPTLGDYFEGPIYSSLEKHREDFGLSSSDLGERLIIVNPVAEKSNVNSTGIKPVAVPGITQVYTHEILEKSKDYYFEGYGLIGGLPLFSQLLEKEDNGFRTLYMPEKKENKGLKILKRVYMDLSAGSSKSFLNDMPTRITFVKESVG